MVIPLVDLRLFKSFPFVIGLVTAFLFYCISVFFLTFGIYLSGLGWTALESGLGIMPFAAGFFAEPCARPSFSSESAITSLALDLD